MNKIMLILVLVLLFFSSFVSAENITNVKYIGNYDGDTVSFNISNLPDVFGKDIHVRLYGIDTPEKKSKNKCEKDIAILAQKFVEQELSNAKVIVLEDCKRDKYFRILAEINYDGKDLTTELLERGYGYIYYGDTKKKVNYCK